MVERLPFGKRTRKGANSKRLDCGTSSIGATTLAALKKVAKESSNAEGPSLASCMNNVESCPITRRTSRKLLK